MAGTVEGGKAAAATNKQRYGKNFYRKIGRKGGKISRGGGFASSHELAVEAGRKGGKASRRGAGRLVERPVVQYEQYHEPEIKKGRFNLFSHFKND